MQGTVKWLDGAMFVGESGSGHVVVMDAPEVLLRYIARTGFFSTS